MTKKIFVSGCAGFMGSHIADSCLRKGYTVTGCDNLIGGYEDNVPKDVIFYKRDLRDLQDTQNMLKGVDIVYHCAATAYEGLSVFSPAFITENISQISANLISSAVRNDVKKFIHCSSMARYGTQRVPFTEDMECKPQDPYGIAKVASEMLLKNMSEVHGMDYTIAVPHNIYGPRQKYDDPYRNVASIMINRMLRGKQPIIYGDGEQERCFSYINDCISCLDQMIDNPYTSKETFNIGPDEEFVSINKLAETIADIMDFDLKPIYMKGRPQEVKQAYCSSDKVRDVLGYNTTYSLREGLKLMIDWIQERGPKEFEYHIPLEIENSLTPETWKKRLI